MQKRTEISELGEFGLIEKLTGQYKTKNPNTIKGIGDDAAIIKTGDFFTAISTDLLVEGIHFDLVYSPLKHLGYKAVVVNLSDIYAMNCYPKQITFSIAISNKYSVEAMQDLYEGVFLACDLYGVDLIGGDTTSSPKGMAISVTAIGSLKEKYITYRSTAKVGDIICVTGNLGAAYLGLQILEREKQIFLSNPNIQPDFENRNYLIRRQLKPEARLDSINYMRKADLVPTAMIDVSDGLSSDLFHICKASGVGAFIEEGKVPIRLEAQEMALKFKLNPISCALSGGEDYEMLFTVDEKDLEKVRYMPNVYIIGEIVDAKDGVKLHTTGGNIHPLQAIGWQHFRK